MNTDLKAFVFQLLRVAVMTLMPVAFTAFATMPYTLGGHPGEARVQRTNVHMT
jgi:hypothetical protein